MSEPKTPHFDVRYEAGTYVARKRGAPGRVFGRTAKEALSNARFWRTAFQHHAMRDRVALSYEKYTTGERAA